MAVGFRLEGAIWKNKVIFLLMSGPQSGYVMHFVLDVDWIHSNVIVPVYFNTVNGGEYDQVGRRLSLVFKRVLPRSGEQQ